MRCSSISCPWIATVEPSGRLLRIFSLSAMMLCKACSAIDFRPLPPAPPDELHYVLHQSRASLDDSLAGGCDLCRLIRSKLDAREGRSAICDVLDAYVVLQRPSPTARSVLIASLLGVAVLDMIDPVPGLCPARVGHATARELPLTRAPLQPSISQAGQRPAYTHLRL